MNSSILKFCLNLVTAGLLFVVFRALLGLIPGFTEPVFLGWGIAELLGLFAALYLVALARRRIPLFRI